jgi:hypothetical protein
MTKNGKIQLTLKIAIYLSLDLHKGRPIYAFSSQREHPALAKN